MSCINSPCGRQPGNLHCLYDRGCPHDPEYQPLREWEYVYPGRLPVIDNKNRDSHESKNPLKNQGV